MLRTDHGTEFVLVQFAQNMFQGYRLSTEGLPFVQPYSKNNLRIERWWVEVNHRVNYPIKKFLRDMEENGSLIYRNDTRWFIVGEFCRRFCEIGIERLVNSWNAHTVPHRGVPNDLETPVGVVSEDIPTGTVLANEYVRLGGSITRPGATHSIYDEVLADARDSHFFSVAGGIEEIYGFVMANRFDLFQSCLREYVNLTQQYLPVEEAYIYSSCSCLPPHNMPCAILYYSFMRVIIDLMLLQIALLNQNRFHFFIVSLLEWE